MSKQNNIFDNCESLEEAVFQAVGAASVAWNPKPTGVFDTQWANTVGSDLLDIIARFKDGVTNAV